MNVLADSIGLLGAGIILAAYFLLQTGKTEQSARYSQMNFVGSFLVLFSLYWAWNLPAFVINSAWAVISLHSLWKRR